MGIEYKSVKGEFVCELVEKRSKFVASLGPVSSQNEVGSFLAKVRKTHYGAKHNAYAYVLFSGQEKFFDDGEPSGTAGQPVLEVLKKNSFLDVICVVSRYFGGILLGRGGLTRAYSGAAKKAVEQAGVVRMFMCDYCKVTCDYSVLDNVLSVFRKSGVFLENKVFNQLVSLYVFSKEQNTSDLKKDLEYVSCGKIKIENLGKRIHKVG